MRDVYHPGEPPTASEMAELLNQCAPLPELWVIVRKLSFHYDQRTAGLEQIAGHSVCCDARHVADKALSESGCAKEVT